VAGLKTKTRKQDKINIVTLGCSKNWVDSEVLLTQLVGNGLPAQHEAEHSDANVVIVNTCGFIDRAKEESINTVLAYADLKAKGKIDKLFVTGCLSERYRQDMQTEMPEIDGVFGTFDMPDLLARFGADYKQELVGERRTATPAHFAYLKISEGCNRPCSFCAIPLMRGKHVSRSIESLVEEAGYLARRGVKELILIAQELTFYGMDLYGERRLHTLLEALAAVPGLQWIRLHYAYPAGFPTEVLPVMAQHPNICRYLDIPLQHAADPVLKRMRRGITQAKTRELVEAIRAQVPGIALRTTMLVGYPGETDDDFAQLVEFVKWARFERLGVFEYSHEENTHAYQSHDDVPTDVKAERAAQLMEVQEAISDELNQGRVGQHLRVMVDRHEGPYAIARSEWDSPEVDNEVLIENGAHLPVGQFATVRITSAEPFDLYAAAD
jgi:ribosomal protein S12 methylthiotransferase